MSEPTSTVFHLLAERYADPLFYTADGIVRWIAPSIEQAVGWSPEEMQGIALPALAHAADAPDLELLLAKVQQGSSGRGVFRLRTKEGCYVWVLITLTAATDDFLGNVSIGSIREINLRVEVERRLRLVAEQTSDVLLTMDAERRIVWVSSSVRRILGWDADDVVGSFIDDLLHPDDRDTAAALYESAAGGQSTGSAHEVVEVRVRNHSGDYHWMRLTTRYLDDGEADTDSIITGLQDVDELVRRRNEIAAHAERLRTILDTNPDVHLVLAPVRDESGGIIDFRYEEINNAGVEYTGRPRSELIGRRLSEVLPTYLDSPFLALEVEVMQTGRPLSVDELLIPSFEVTGEDTWVSMRAVRVGDSLSVVWRDVTDRVREVHLIEASEEKFRLLAENVTDVVVRIRDDVVEWVSPSLTDTLGWSPEDWVGRDLHSFLHVEDLPGHADIHDQLEAGEKVTYRSRLRAADLSYHWADIAQGPFINAHGDVDGLVMSFRLVDVEVATEAALDRRARFDDLTGLANRAEVLARIGTIGEHQRRPGSQTAILFCDVDRFKAVNDTFGHAAGDAVLRELAERLSGAIRSGDIAARVGGDELLAVLEGVHDIDDALRVAEKIRAAACEPITVPGDQVTSSLSIGVTLARPGESTDALVERADEAMYRAKQGGRNRVFTMDEAAAGDQPSSRSSGSPTATRPGVTTVAYTPKLKPMPKTESSRPR